MAGKNKHPFSPGEASFSEGHRGRPAGQRESFEKDAENFLHKKLDCVPPL